MRIRDGSSDVCSSDLDEGHLCGRRWDRRGGERAGGNRRLPQEAGEIHQAWRDSTERRAAGRCAGDREDSPGTGRRRRGRSALLFDERCRVRRNDRSEEHTSELQSLMRISYAVFCLKKKKKITNTIQTYQNKTT